MHIVVNRDRLAHTLNHVSKAVSSRTTIPILTGIKMTATQEEFILTGSDSDISIQATVPLEEEGKEIVKVVKIGSIVIPARYLTEIVKKLPEDLVEIEVIDQYVTVIRSGSAEFNLNGLNPEEYPRLPEIEANKQFTVPSDLLKSMIKQTVFAVSTQESRPILTGILWRLEEGKLSFVATDSHRLAQREINVVSSGDLAFNNIVVPGKSLNELQRLLDDEETEVDIVVTQNQILVKVSNILFYSRILEGTYPDTSRIIPQQSKTELVIQTKQLLQAIERASLLAKDGKHVVQLHTSGQQDIHISSNTPEVGKVTEKISINSFEGEEIKISFNAKYVLDALRVTEDPEIKIGFTGAMSPFIIYPTDNKRTLHLVLPVRTY